VVRLDRWLAVFFLMGLVTTGILSSSPAQEEPPLPVGLESKSSEEEPELPTGLAPHKSEEPPLPTGLKSKTGEPELPAGLAPEKKEEPALPTGLTAPKKGEEPSLPAGLGEKPARERKPVEKPIKLALPFELTGFLEARGGVRLRDDRYEKDASIGEMRLQLEAEKHLFDATFRVVTDWVYDPVFGHHSVYLEDGRGFLDLREANVAFSPLPFADVKVGRQILTWGTGDLLFLNDLFPKDWNSFFIGRDVEYLKAPSDALKVSLFSDIANLDVVFTPRFDADRFIDGKRISYYNQMLRRIAGRDAVVSADYPEDWFNDYEIAWRVSRTIKSYELAAYGYYGYWKSPAGMNPQTMQAVFPRLSVYGASVRGAVWKGIGNVEFAFYDSRQDRGGDNPFIRNSELRLLLGYEQDLGHDFSIGMQYYIEYMLDYGDYRRNLPSGFEPADESHHILTLRLTKLLLNQNLELSFFAFFSPTDGDAYLRPRVHYKISDAWAVEAGGNLFMGKDDYTFFGQFKDNTNLYVGLRWSF